MQMGAAPGIWVTVTGPVLVAKYLYNSSLLSYIIVSQLFNIQNKRLTNRQLIKVVKGCIIC